jgi:glucose-6-phosphate 1-dehydrogenase
LEFFDMSISASPAQLFVIFGATGDLAERMLLPSLYGLHKDKLLPDSLIVLGTSRSSLSDSDFAAHVRTSIEKRVPKADQSDAAIESFLARVRYQGAAIDDQAAFDALAVRVRELRNGDVVYHLSTAPKFYAAICAKLSCAGLAGAGTRVLLEKPIGSDLNSANAINDGVGKAFEESRIFRVDHYLGKEGVQNLLALRFGNALFEPLWNARHIEQVQITVAETIGVEGRADYYDESGAMRDMLQNHMLQLLCLTAMEPPSHFDPGAVRNEKLKVLQSLQPIDASGLATHTVFGQYTAGAVEGLAVPGYASELSRASNTETFVALRAEINNWRWAGVPFYLRTGKRMPRRATEIYLQFRDVPHSIFPNSGMQQNALLIQLQPEERIELKLMNKTPGLDRGGVKLSEVGLDLDWKDAFSTIKRRLAYERLYLDAIEGIGTLFVRRDETEAAWTWVDTILRAQKNAGGSPKNYPAGTWGPSSAVTLTERFGHSWRE